MNNHVRVIILGTAIELECSQPINVVILLSIDPQTRKQTHVILFSSDLNSSHKRNIQLHQLRFQIKFIFRDTKQHSGLADFMNISPPAVKNAVSLAIFMTMLSRPSGQPSRCAAHYPKLVGLHALSLGYQCAY
jgi:hypothetical protein